jgi:hypothetical protein
MLSVSGMTPALARKQKGQSARKEFVMIEEKKIQLVASPENRQAVANTGRTPTPVTTNSLTTTFPENAGIDASATSIPPGPRTMRLADRSLVR